MRAWCTDDLVDSFLDAFFVFDKRDLLLLLITDPT